MNLFDKYYGSEYVPLPFEQYLQAGQMQQKQYDMLKDNMNQIEDKYADMKVRPVDVAYKNSIIDEVHRGAVDMLGNHKYYSPDMFQDVRSYIRKQVRDPRFANLGAAYENYSKEREIEERLRAQGKDYFYNHEHNLKTPLYTQDGTLNFDPSSVGLGIEEGLNYANAAMSFTNKLTPYISKGKAIEGTVKLTRPDGTVINVPTIRQENISRLSSSDPRVQKDVRDMVVGFTGTPEGRQYVKRYATNPDGTINQDKVFNYLLSTVAEKSSTEWGETFLPGFASMMRIGGGNGKQPIPNTSDTWAGLNPNPLTSTPSTTRAIKYLAQPGPDAYSKLTEHQRKELEAFAKEEFSKGLKTEKSNRLMELFPGDAGTKNFSKRILSYDEWLKQEGANANNPFGNVLNTWINSQIKSKDGRYSAEVYNMAPNQAAMEFLSKGASGVSPDNAILLSGDHEGQLAGNKLEGISFDNFQKVPTGEIIAMKDPANPKLKTFASKYNVIVDKDTAKKLGIDVSDNNFRAPNTKVVNADGKEEAGYAVPIMVPHNKMVTPESLAQYDKSKDANWDEKYNTAGAYQNDYQLWKINTFIQQNFDAVKEKVKALKGDLDIDQQGNFIIKTPQGIQVADPVQLYTLMTE